MAERSFVQFSLSILYCVFHGVADDGHMYGRRARSNFRPGTVAWRVAGRTRVTA
jgi:hypothetical protein